MLDNRGRYVSDTLIIVRAYLMAGSPGKLSPLASFNQWSDLVRSALVWLGCDDPVSVMEQSREEDPGLIELAEMLDFWGDTFGTRPMTIKAVVSEANQERFEADEHGDIHEYSGKRVFCRPELRDALIRVSGGRGEIDSRKLGMWMKAQAGRIIGTRRFLREDGETDGAARWKLQDRKA